MDAMDILGGLLGGKSNGSGGLGGKILKDILSGGSRRSSAPSNIPTSQQAGGRPQNRRVDIDQQADALEDLLNVANGQSSQSRRGTEHSTSNKSERQTQQNDRIDPDFQFPLERPQGRPPQIDPKVRDRQTQNQRALVLIRAMINAAKADGRLTPKEQKNLFDYLGDTSKSAVQFLQNEFNQPLDVREFAWNVPLGMEQQVYTMSVASIDLDVKTEAEYLKELAHGLRLAPEVCNAIHQRHNAPTIF